MMFDNGSLLLIEPFTALPQTSGGRTRIFHTIKELKKYFNLTVWNFIANNKEELAENAWLDSLQIPFRHFLIKPKSFFSFLLVGQPYWFSDWYSQELASNLQSETKNFPIIQVEFSQLLYLIKFLPKASKKIFVAHDISTISFWRRLQTEKNYLKKFLHFLRWIEIYLYERKYLPKFDLVIAVSDNDAKKLKTYFDLKNIKIVPNGVEKINFLPARQKDGYINLGYIGSFEHAPNVEAVKFLLNKILPELENQQIKYRLYLAGKNSNELIDSLIKKSPINDKSAVKNWGYLERLKDFYQNIDLLVAPIFAGSGTRIKILECLSYGRPVVTTEIGAEGIEIKSNLLKILDNNEKVWTEKIVYLSNFKNQLINKKDQIKKQLLKVTWENMFLYLNN